MGIWGGLTVALGLGIGACGESTEVGQGATSGDSGAVEVAPDVVASEAEGEVAPADGVAVETAVDAVPNDTATDTATDTTPEVPDDTSIDTAPVDTTPEVPDATTATDLDDDTSQVIEVADDTALDTTPEVADDTSPEVGDETALDTTPEVDAGPESLPPADLGLLSGHPYLMWVTQTEVSVRWETNVPVVGRVDFGPDDSLGSTLSEPVARTTHELRLTGLPPANDNSYRVVYSGGALPIRHFRTAPPDDSDAAFHFIVWGDNQNGPNTFDDLVLWMSAYDPDFALSVGDCVQNGTRAEYRSQLFAPMMGFADQVPFLVAAGNHERYSDPSASLFNEYLSQPGDEHCFGWRYGGLYVLVLDTDLGLDGATGQRACVNAALSSPEAQGARIQAAIFHKPPRIEFWFGGLLAFTKDMEAAYVRNDLEPLLESYGVDIVFNGHNHLYAYTPETVGGVTWVTTGGGGGMLDTPGFLNIWRVGTWPQIQKTLSEYHFLSVTMDGSELQIEAVDTQGAVLHSFAVSGD